MINPIKSRREMLMEMAGMPRYNAGSKVVKAVASKVAPQFEKQVAASTDRFRTLFGRDPSEQERKTLADYLESLSKPTSPPAPDTPATRARAQFALRTDPNINSPRAPDVAPDPFLTKAMTGRTVKGTYLQPQAYDIAAPEIAQKIEQQQMGGALDELIPGASRGSTTPSADYFGEMSSLLEQGKLAQPIRRRGAPDTNIYDQLMEEFRSKTGRSPTFDELNALIADFNPLRHQYGEKGISVIGERPRSRTGMEEFRRRARAEGIEESALMKPPADYPQYLKDELMIQSGELPAKAMGGLVAMPMAGGGSSSYAADMFRGARDAYRGMGQDYANMAFGLGREPSDMPEMRAGPANPMPLPETQSMPYRFAHGLTGFVGDPVGAVAGPFMGPMAKAGMRALRLVRQNPRAIGAMLGLSPAAGMPTTPDNEYRSVLERRYGNQ